MKEKIISAKVYNHSGVLTRISGLFARRGYNIESLTVCDTEDNEFSRMTIVASGDEDTIEQICKQLEKLPDVTKVEIMDEKSAILLELLLIKIVNNEQNKELATTFSAKLLCETSENSIYSLTDTSLRVEEFINSLSSDTIIELTKSGLSALYK